MAAGRIIGTPYQGTHARAFNIAGGSNNWESENAVDISTPVGSPIVAVTDGVIGQQFGSLGEGGRFAGLRLHLDGGGNEYYYAHLSRFAPGIGPGVQVRAGQLLGYSGEANGVPHLHFAAVNGNPVHLLKLASPLAAGSTSPHPVYVSGAPAGTANDPSAMQDYFSSEVAKQTGLDPRVVKAWSSQEGTYAPNGTGGFNFLNLRPYSSDVGVVSHSSGGFDQFRSLQDAIASTVTRIRQPFLQSHLAPVLKAGGGPAAQIAAIAASGWDQDHYGGPGGPNLLRAYQGVQAPTTTYNRPGGDNTGGATLVSGAALPGTAGTAPPQPVVPYVPPPPPDLPVYTPPPAATPITLLPAPPATATTPPPTVRQGAPPAYDPANDRALAPAEPSGPLRRLYPVAKLNQAAAPLPAGASGGPLRRLFPVSKLGRG